jgi:hypothetical protein
MGRVPTTTTDATPAFLTDALRAGGALGPDSSVAEVEHDTIGEGVGITGTLARLTLRYSGTATGAPSSVILKLPSEHPENRAIGDIFKFYEREGRFYDELAPTVPVCVPRAYFNHMDPDANEFALILEDFGHRTLVSQIAGIDSTRAAEAIRAIALVHARWWQSPELDALGWMPRAIDPGILAAGPQYRATWPAFVELLGDAMPEGTIELGERVGASWEATQTALFEGAPVTLCHGDFRADNLMFDDDAEGRDHVGVIDWQIAYQGGGIADVCYLVTQSMTIDDRRRHERELVALWYDAVCSALGAPPDGYSEDDAWRDYRAVTGNMTVYGVVSAGGMDPSNERGRQLVRDMAERAFTAALDLDAANVIAP